MNGRYSENNYKAQLADRFNQFYLQITSSDVQQIGNYQITSDLGEGAFGKVYLANHVLLNVPVVLKCGPKDDPNIVREIYYHSQLRHKHIVKLYEVIKTETHLWMVLEYCEGNELYYHIYNSRRLDYKQCQKLFYQIILGVSYVHLLNLCHRDLKLENILLADLKKTLVKLTDFGFVREFNPKKRSLLSTICGTTVYMAPEMLASSKYSGFLADVWSLGVILYTMLYGEMPFDEDDDMQNKYMIVNEEPKYREIIPKDAIELIKMMLVKDPKKRATLTDILNSSFLQGMAVKRRSSNSTSKRRISDSESILSINQHYQALEQQGGKTGANSGNHNTTSGASNAGVPPNNSRQPFETKIEKNLLKSFTKLNVDLEQIQQNIIENKTNTLTAFYELALTREYKRKKLKYYQERRKRYKEAKRSLKNSKQKVKSALSLTDQANGTQPLERILSSLSISSRGGAGGSVSGQGRPGDRRSIISMSRENGGSSGTVPQATSSSVPLLASPATNPSIGSISMAPANPNAAGQQSPSSRAVSFLQPERDTASTSSSTYPYLVIEDKTRKRRILNKLQFWKKGAEEMDDIHEEKNSIGNTISISTSSEGNEKGNDEKNGIKGNNKYSKVLDKTKVYNFGAELSSSAHKPPIEVSSDSADMNNKGNTDANNPMHLNSLHVNKSNSNNSINNNNSTMLNGSTTVNSTNGSFSAATSRDISGYYTSKNRTRPSSLISQVSQLSHLSQLSTMISESELDMLGGTDTDDYYDEDGMYESSVNNSHSDLKNLPASMAPSSSANSRRGTRKRPSYRRTMSSDMSILSTSTNNTAAHYKTKPKLSQVSSNASSISDQSSLNGTDSNFMAPVALEIPDRTQSPAPQLIMRSSSPLQLRAPVPMDRTKINPLTNENGSGNGNGFASTNIFNTFINGILNEPFARSHSPPVPEKFSKMRRRPGASDKGKHLPGAVLPLTGTPPTSSSTVPTIKDTHQVEDKVVKTPKAATSMYEPKFTINEEEEDED